MTKINLLAFGQVLMLCGVMITQNSSPANEWQVVEQALGRAGQVQPDGAYKVGMPRGDLSVTVVGTQIKPTLALGSWVAFSKPGIGAMMMGDLVLTENEVTPVMTSLQSNGIEITALHNHVLHESPRVMYMHIGRPRGRRETCLFSKRSNLSHQDSRTKTTGEFSTGSGHRYRLPLSRTWQGED